MKIFLDDIRNPPDDTWTLCRTAEEVANLISPYNNIEEMSLDHDLGTNMSTGYDLLVWIERAHAQGKFLYGIRNTKYTIHSANPVGRKNMQAAIDSIYRFKK